jgi:hypothetical protein
VDHNLQRHPYATVTYTPHVRLPPVKHNLPRQPYATVTNLCKSHIHGPRYLNTMLLLTHSQLPTTSPLHLPDEVPTKTIRKPNTYYGSLDTTSPLLLPYEVPTKTSRKPNTCYGSLDTTTPYSPITNLWTSHIFRPR